MSLLHLNGIVKRYPGVLALDRGIAVIYQGTALEADAVQHPVDIGRRTIETVVAYLRGTSVPSRIAVPVRLLTRDSLTATRYKDGAPC